MCAAISKLPLLRILLKGVDCATASDADLAAAMWRRFLPKSKLAAEEQFMRYAVPAKSPLSGDSSAFHDYLVKCLSLWNRLPEAVRPAFRRVRGIFVSGLSPVELRRHLAADLDGASSFEEMIEQTLKVVENFSKVHGRRDLSLADADGGDADTGRGAPADVVQTDAMADADVMPELEDSDSASESDFDADQQ